MQGQSFLASNVYAGQHPKPQHKHWVPTLLPTLFFALHKQDSASGSFKQQFPSNLHSVSVVHFALIDANWRISSISRGFGLLDFINDITKASSFDTTFLLMILNLHMSNSCFNVLQTTVNLELCYVKLTTGWEPTSFLLTTIRLILC